MFRFWCRTCVRRAERGSPSVCQTFFGIFTCPDVGFFCGTRPHGLHLKLARAGLTVTHIPEAQRSVSDEISPRCGSGDCAHRAQRDQPRYEASSQCWGLSADPSGSTPPGKATSNPTYQDVDRAHWTLAAPGLFTTFDVCASQHRGTFKRLNTAALGHKCKDRPSLLVTGTCFNRIII